MQNAFQPYGEQALSVALSNDLMANLQDRAPDSNEVRILPEEILRSRNDIRYSRFGRRVPEIFERGKKREGSCGKRLKFDPFRGVLVIDCR